jgi:predicted  nucleic acid-binding Zn-ribbon protein
LKDENVDLKSELSKFSEAYKKYRDYEKEELAESCYDLARENDKLKERIKELEKEIEELNKMMLFETKI